eukprot:m.60495 g.60495  ORF g.60495 m.60495 type:complete len:262 (+) comp13666_c0_seq2:241-1026(+)
MATAARELRRVLLPSDVYAVCLTHALSTEHEEVMGLLIGDVSPDGVATVCSSLVLCRSDRRKDRVEISVEQLCSASAEAERIASSMGRPELHIIGWYHSHPHITIWPSHVDVGTQEMYQGMDPTFIGLIFSCFSDDQQKVGKMEVTCFQSVNIQGVLERSEIPLEILRTPFGRQPYEALVNLPRILFQEEKDAFKNALEAGGSEDVLKTMWSNSVYQRALCDLLRHVSAPLMSALSMRKEAVDMQCERVARRIKLYEPTAH